MGASRSTRRNRLRTDTLSKLTDPNFTRQDNYNEYLADSYTLVRIFLRDIGEDEICDTITRQLDRLMHNWQWSNKP